MVRQQLEAGTTEECLVKFNERFSFLAAKRFLAEFAQVTPQTVDTWFRKERQPTGLVLIRTRVFLSLTGYRVQEFDSVPEDNQKLARIIALNLIDAKQVKSDLGYRDDQGVYDLILRGRTMMPASSLRLEKVLTSYKESVEVAAEEFLQRLDRVLSGEVGVGPSPARPTPPSPDSAPNGTADMSQEELDQLLLAMDQRNEALTRELEEEKKAHEATKGELERVRLEYKPVSVSADLARKYLHEDPDAPRD